MAIYDPDSAIGKQIIVRGQADFMEASKEIWDSIEELNYEVFIIYKILHERERK